MYPKLCWIRYISVSSPSATAPLFPYTFADPIDLNSAPYNIVEPSVLKCPVDPFTAYNPLSAKYVNELSHSTLTPFVIVSASTPGVINVTAWNNILASLLVPRTLAPSTRAPLPASALAYPLGSLALVVLPCVLTVMFCTYGLRDVTVALGANLNAYPTSLPLS